jgi:hypothetical protein
MTTPLETDMVNSLHTIVNDPTILGLIVLCLFGGFVIMQNSRLDQKVAIIVPAVILAAAMISWVFLVLAVILGAVIFYPALRRLFG